MSQSYLTSYQPIGYNEETQGREDEDLSPDNYQDTGMLVHTVPKSDKTRWNHIEDLDTFFTRIYQYHQQHGFHCLIGKQITDILKFLIIIILTVIVFAGINYSVLFNYKRLNNHKTSLLDCFNSLAETWNNIPAAMFFFLIAAFVFWIVKIFLLVISYYQYGEIKKFYNIALGIDDANLGNVTWNEVKQRLMEVQVEQRMCIHKEALSELDIYHRILRFDNYFIAMVNNNVIPLKIQIPCLGEVTYLTRGLRFNLDLLLFTGFGAPFNNNWHLRDEYKRVENRHQLAELLNKRIWFLGILNFVFVFFILLFQCLHKLFHVAVDLKQDSSYLATRIWSHYARVCLRHYNELDHELFARFNRAFRCASQYADSFTSPLASIIGGFFAFNFGAIAVILWAFTIYDEDVLHVEHYLTLVSVCTFIAAGSRIFIPKENQVWCPEVLLNKVKGEVHYLPYAWRAKAHTSHVRDEFANLFQYKFVRLLESLLSPLVTPFILCFVVRFRTLEIVDFLRNFTVEVVGVGDICSFAQMSLRKHGSKTWHSSIFEDEDSAPQPSEEEQEEDPAKFTDHGKTELSLLHFVFTNPNWKPPQEAFPFFDNFVSKARKDYEAMPALNEENALYNSLYSLTQSGAIAPHGNDVYCSQRYGISDNVPSRRVNPLHVGQRQTGLSVGILGSLSPLLNNSSAPPSCASNFPLRNMDKEIQNLLSPTRTQDMAAIDMSISALYLHELHHRRRVSSHYTDVPVGIQMDRGATNTFRIGEAIRPSSTESYYHSTDPPTGQGSYYPSALNPASDTPTEVSSHEVFRESTPLINYTT